MSLLMDLLINIVMDIVIVWAIARQDRKKPGDEYDKEKLRLRIESIEGEEEIMKGREERKRMLDIIDRSFEEEE